MHFFNEIETTLAHLGLGTNNFTRIAGKIKIPRLLIRLYIALSPVMFGLLQVALYILRDNINDRLMAVAIFMACVPLTPIYVSLASKTNEIDELFRYVEKLVNSSNAKLL